MEMLNGETRRAHKLTACYSIRFLVQLLCCFIIFVSLFEEAAEYIAFFDMDDILFPKTYPRYIEEFQAEWSVDPTSNSIYYGRREHEFVKGESQRYRKSNLIVFYS